MRLSSAIAIYFVIWWIVLFMVLPWGVRSPHEAGEAVEAGHDAGAPVNPRLKAKAIVTTILAALIFAAFYLAKTQGLLAF